METRSWLGDSMSGFSGTAEAETYDEQVSALSAASKLNPMCALNYGEDSRQRIEFYRPVDAPKEERLPVLIFMHGGAWIAGGLGWLRFMAEAVTSQRAVLAAVSYRLAPDHKWPSQLEDAVAAIRLVQSQADRFSGDPDRIVVGGHSAGGQMAAMAVLTGNIGPVRGCMPVSSPMDLRYGRGATDTGKGRVYRYLLADPVHDTDASPICHVDGNKTPFHLTWGERDIEHIGNSCERMVTAMSDAGQPVRYHVMPAANHFDTHLKLSNAQGAWYRTFRSLIA